MATQVELVKNFAEGRISLDEIVAQIGGAKAAKRATKPVKSLADVERDPDGDASVGDSAAVKLYGALCAKKISEAEYDAVYAALAAK